MFKKNASSVDELVSDMSAFISKNVINLEADKISKAVDLIARAGDIFERNGKIEEAIACAQLLEVFAAAESGDKALKHNLLETGTLFSKKEFHCNDCNDATDHVHEKDELEIDPKDEKIVEDMLDADFDDVE